MGSQSQAKKLRHIDVSQPSLCDGLLQVDAAALLDRVQHGKREQHALAGLLVGQGMFRRTEQKRRPRRHLFGVALTGKRRYASPASAMNRELLEVLDLGGQTGGEDGADLLRPRTVALGTVNELSAGT